MNLICLGAKLIFSRWYEANVVLALTDNLKRIKNLHPLFFFFCLESNHSALISFSYLKGPKYSDFCRFINSFCFLVLIVVQVASLSSYPGLAWQALFKVKEFFGFSARIHCPRVWVIVEWARCLGARDYGYFQCVNPKGIGQHQFYPLSKVLEFFPEKIVVVLDN